MPRLTELAHQAVRERLAPGEAAVDATAGNGHDTRFLLACVGAQGRVFAFDVQPEALARAAEATGYAPNVTFLQRDHADMSQAIPAAFHGHLGAVMFNLGYLPGGDHAITTQTASTLQAIAAALELLRPGGVLTVVAYTGHPGGAQEAAAVRALLDSVAHAWQVHEYRAGDAPPFPQLFVVHKQAPTG